MKFAYNQRITQWNHKTTVQMYKNPIYVSEPTVQNPLQVTGNENKKKNTKPRKKFKDMSDDEKEVSNHRRILYFKKRVNYLCDIAIHNNLNIFCTLTFKEDVTEYEVAKKYWGLFLQRLKYKLKTQYQVELKYIAVHELQKKRNVYHFHFMSNLPYIPQNELSQLWKYGFLHITKVPAYSIRYSFKYIVKDVISEQEHEVRDSSRKIYTSRNLEKPNVIKHFSEETPEDVIFSHMEMADNDYMYEAIDQNGKQINNISVIELKKSITKV